MARLLRIYFNAVFGAVGGLLGWMLFGEFADDSWGWEAKALVGGAIIGALIGYFVVSVDAILDRSLVRFARYATYGVMLGVAGGMLGYWLGDWVNKGLQEWIESPGLRTPMAVLARGLGWMVFGLFIGASEGIAAKSMGKFWYGTVGGLIGGFIGGLIFGALIEAAGKDRNAAIYVWGQALGLVILGACIGGLIALVEEVFKPASLKVLLGWQEGREYPLIKPASVVGRDEGADVMLLRDMKIEKRHIVIHRRDNRFVMVNNQAPADHTLVNDVPIAGSCELRDGDRIRLGGCVLRFQMRAAVERKKRPRAIPMATPAGR